MIYLFQVTVYSALLYAVYLLILKNRASHEWNRAYLLLCATLPLAIPFIRIPALYNSIPVSAGTLSVLLPEVHVLSQNNTTTEISSSNRSYINIIYLLISAGILCRTSVQYIIFARFAKQSKREVVSGVKVLVDTQTGPGSFQDYIFIPGDKIDRAIFDHELAHISLKHSWDVLFIRLVQILFWPDIMLYVILRELKIVHEFQADAYAVKNKESYINTLLNDTFGTRRFSLSHTFFYHPLKRRIMMLHKSPLNRTKVRMALLKTGFSAAVLLTGIVYLQSCRQEKGNQIQSPAQAKMTAYDTISLGKTIGHPEVLTKADVMPKADYDIAKFMAENLKYPESSRKTGIEGKVFVKFIVDETGSIVQPEIMRSPDTTLSAEALRVINMMPKWKPGEQGGKRVAVFFYLPIMFSLGTTETLPVRPRQITIMPGASKGAFTVRGATGKGNDEEVSIEITDATGHVVYSKQAVAHKGDLNEQVQLSNIVSNGMYVLNVRSVSLNQALHFNIQR